MGTLLELRGVDVRYGRRLALAGVDLRIGAGELVAVVGPNGAGKTTLFRAALGLLEPAAGSIARPVAPAYVPQQDDEDLTYPLTALDVVLIGAYRRRRFWQPLGRELRRQGIAELDRVGLADRARSPIGELSGGQRQRVLLARALMARSPLLLLDEPLNGVDVGTREIVLGVLRSLAAAGSSVLLATHDLALARAIASRVLFVNGRIVADGPPAETFTAETLRETFSGSVFLLDRGAGVEILDPGAHGHEHRL